METVQRLAATAAFLALGLSLIIGYARTRALAEPASQNARRVAALGTGSVGGVYFSVGEIVCGLTAKPTASRGVPFRCQANATGGSVDNVAAVLAGDLDLALVQSDILAFAYAGIETFEKTGPQKNLRTILSLQTEDFTVVARDGTGVDSFETLAGKNVNLGAKGTGYRQTVELLTRESGIGPAFFGQALELKQTEAIAALGDGRLDAYIYVTGHPSGFVLETANACHVRLVPVTGPIIDAFLAKRPYYPKTTIPSGLYRGTNEPIPTFGVRATIATTDKLPEEEAYWIARATLENLSELKSLHPALARLEPTDLPAGGLVPLHKGAERYFREAGLLK
jgi:TRAP transporter TAXI family solute receptor